MGCAAGRCRAARCVVLVAGTRDEPGKWPERRMLRPGFRKPHSVLIRDLEASSVLPRSSPHHEHRCEKCRLAPRATAHLQASEFPRPDDFFDLQFGANRRIVFAT